MRKITLEKIIENIQVALKTENPEEVIKIELNVIIERNGYEIRKNSEFEEEKQNA